MRIFIFTIIALLNIIFQSTLLNYLPILSTLPNISFVLVVVYTILRNQEEGITFAFFIGLLQSIVLDTSLGFYSLLYMATAYIVGMTFLHYYKKNILPAIIDTFALTFFYQILIYTLEFFFKGNVDFSYYFFNIMLTEGIYNVLVVVIIYYPIYFINKKLELYEKPKRNVFK